MFEIRYAIRPGDSLWKLSQIFHTSVESLMELNPGIDPLNLQVGRIIVIRPGDAIKFPIYSPPNSNNVTQMQDGRYMMPNPMLPNTQTSPMMPNTQTSPMMPTPSMPPMMPTPSTPPIMPTPSTPPVMPNTQTSPMMPNTQTSPMMPNTQTSPMTPNSRTSPMTPNTQTSPMTPNSRTSPMMPNTQTSPMMPTPSMPPMMPNTSSPMMPNISTTPMMPTPQMPTPQMPTTPNPSPSNNMMPMPMEDMMDLNEENCMDIKLVDLVSHFRMLWMQYIMWGKLAIMATMEELPSASAFINRLMENPVDFANALKVFYGEDVGNEFARLFSDHITIGTDIAKALKVGDTEGAKTLNARWEDNKEKLANFLASINPSWRSEDWSAMLQEHLELLREAMDNTLNQRFTANVRNLDELDIQGLEMADMMGEGIFMQFPD